MPMATLDDLRVEVRFLGRMLADIGGLICQLNEGLRSLLAILAVLLHVRDQGRLTRIGSNPRGLPASRNRSIPTSLGSALSAPSLATSWYILSHLLSSRPPRSPKVIDLT